MSVHVCWSLLARLACHLTFSLESTTLAFVAFVQQTQSLDLTMIDIGIGCWRKSELCTCLAWPKAGRVKLTQSMLGVQRLGPG